MQLYEASAALLRRTPYTLQTPYNQEFIILPEVGRNTRLEIDSAYVHSIIAISLSCIRLATI
jgi:hypothetical protein